MPFVLDASMSMSWCFADENTPFSLSVLRNLSETYAEVPAIWPLEIAKVLAVNERKGRILASQSDEFLATLASLDIRIEHHSPDPGALMRWIRGYGLSAYDAAYLELAKRKDLPIATFDRHLVTAASSEGIALVAKTR